MGGAGGGPLMGGGIATVYGCGYGGGGKYRVPPYTGGY
jgi:hypothetical protein